MFRRDFFGKGILAGLFGSFFVAKDAKATNYLVAGEPIKWAELEVKRSEPKFRVWKLGSHEHKIYPTKAAFEKLKGLIDEAKKTEGTFDLIWDSSLEVVEVGGGGEDVILMEDVCKKYLESTGKYFVIEKPQFDTNAVVEDTKLRDIYVSPEALEEINNWLVKDIEHEVRKVMYT
jgi:hypothetical protein